MSDAVCDYGHSEAEHEQAGACERPPIPPPGLSLLRARFVGEPLARHAVACQLCGALVLRNLNAMSQHMRHHSEHP